MKPYVLLSALLFFSIASYGQVFVGGVNINEDKNAKIIEVSISERMGKYVNVFVDYGQRSNFSAARTINSTANQEITDPESGKEMKFVSTAAVLNFMERNHWEHYDSMVEAGRNDPVCYFYFRKKQ